MASIVQLMQHTTDQHTLIFTAPDVCPARVDPIRFEQVVTNLVGNAVKYSPGGGSVEITLSAPDPHYIQLVVRDWGLGIPVERRGKLFDLFYQAHGEGHFGGLGLGLYVSRQIVELHGGTIDAEFPSGGSRFIVSLPATSAGLRPAGGSTHPEGRSDQPVQPGTPPQRAEWFSDMAVGSVGV